jgi:hypothetical protein
MDFPLQETIKLLTRLRSNLLTSTCSLQSTRWHSSPHPRQISITAMLADDFSTSAFLKILQINHSREGA